MATERATYVNVWVSGKVFAVDAEHREVFVETSAGHRAIIQPEHFDEAQAIASMGRRVYCEGLRAAGLPMIMRAHIHLSQDDGAGEEMFAAPDREGE